jgi:glyceraldehyde-3-phosphate dehydrogenase, type I
MALKIAINGFGRIGRCAARIALSRDDVELVAINDTAKREITRYLLQYDTIHREFNKKVEVIDDDYIAVDGKKIRVFSTRDPHELKFSDFGAQAVLECTGAFLTQESCEAHIKNGANLVVISAPAKDDTPTFVMGVNEETYAGEKIISNASCTTNCLAPIAKIIDKEFKIIKGLMTTTHAYTSSQSLVDVKTKDFRRSRAAALNIIPTSTGAAKAINLVLPNLAGKLNGTSLRVPVANVSIVDLNVLVQSEISAQIVNETFREYAKKLGKILLVDDDKRVSSDFCSSEYSSIIASDVTQVVDKNLLKVMAWYDNEWGYSNRLVDLCVFAAKFQGIK